MEERYKTGDEPISDRYGINEPASHDLGTGTPSYPRISRREIRRQRGAIGTPKFSDRVRSALKQSKKYHKKPEK